MEFTDFHYGPTSGENITCSWWSSHWWFDVKISRSRFVVYLKQIHFFSVIFVFSYTIKIICLLIYLSFTSHVLWIVVVSVVVFGISVYGCVVHVNFDLFFALCAVFSLSQSRSRADSFMPFSVICYNQTLARPCRWVEFQ